MALSNIIPNEELIAVLRVLLALRPRQRRLIRDFPPAAAKSGDFLLPQRDVDDFARLELVSCANGRLRLTLHGIIAQSEVQRAEQYVSDVFPRLVQDI